MLRFATSTQHQPIPTNSGRCCNFNQSLQLPCKFDQSLASSWGGGRRCYVVTYPAQRDTVSTAPGSGEVGAGGAEKPEAEAAGHLRPRTLPSRPRAAPPQRKCDLGGVRQLDDPHDTEPPYRNPPGCVPQVADRTDPTRLPLNGFTPC